MYLNYSCFFRETRKNRLMDMTVEHSSVFKRLTSVATRKGGPLYTVQQSTLDNRA